MAVWTVDLSKWDGFVSIPKLKDAGVGAVIAKCGGGDQGLYTDSKWETNYANCKAVGMPVGAYFYSAATNVNQAVEEAKYVLKLLKGKQLEYPVYIDIEEKSQQALSESALRGVIKAWLDTIGDGWMRGVYTWAWLMPSGLDCETWFCAWTKNKPAECGMWQFGGETNQIRSVYVAGYGPMDQSYAYKDYPTIIKDAGLNGFSKKKEEGVPMSTARERLLEVARSQLGVRYWSMHTGPKGSAEPGWGCAMFVAWCYKQVLGTDYYGSCWNFAGDALGQSCNQGGGEWRFISANEALPGDCVLYVASGYTGTDYDDYGHIAMYVGNGNVIGAMGRGVPGGSNYLNIGISETPTAKQSIGGIMRFIRCTRLDGMSEEDYPMAQKVTFSRPIYVRTSPSTKNMSNVCKKDGRYVRYAKGDSCTIEGVTFADGRVWGYYTGTTSKQRRYVSLGTTNNATVGK